ncbi:MAG TPA: hypothetical protein VMY35_04770 [Phycisphaerae bacterium]|nr:hypothetical protein [Phycisphaerae bacterium]
MSDTGHGSAHLWVPGASASWQPGVRKQTVEAIDRTRLKRFEEFESLLKEMGLQLVCARCTALFGPGQDGVRGNNNPAAEELSIECGCTRRICKVGG